jgi:hypothetical protein
MNDKQQATGYLSLLRSAMRFHTFKSALPPLAACFAYSASRTRPAVGCPFFVAFVGSFAALRPVAFIIVLTVDFFVPVFIVCPQKCTLTGKAML